MEGPLQGCAAQVHLNAIPFLASNPVDFHRFPQKSTKITTWTGYRIWIHLEAAKLNPWRIQADFFFRTVDYAAECCTCCRFYSNRILPISTKLMVSRTVVLPGATWWRKSLRLPFRFVPAVNHHLSFTAKTGWFQYQTHPILIRDSLRVNKILTD